MTTTKILGPSATIIFKRSMKIKNLSLISRGANGTATILGGGTFNGATVHEPSVAISLKIDEVVNVSDVNGVDGYTVTTIAAGSVELIMNYGNL